VCLALSTLSSLIRTFVSISPGCFCLSVGAIQFFTVFPAGLDLISTVLLALFYRDITEATNNLSVVKFLRSRLSRGVCIFFSVFILVWVLIYIANSELNFSSPGYDTVQLLVLGGLYTICNAFAGALLIFNTLKLLRVQYTNPPSSRAVQMEKEKKVQTVRPACKWHLPCLPDGGRRCGDHKSSGVGWFSLWIVLDGNGPSSVQQCRDFDNDHEFCYCEGQRAKARSSS